MTPSCTTRFVWRERPRRETAGLRCAKELLRFTFPRQREGRKLSISDFFAPKSSGKMDVIGLVPGHHGRQGIA